MYPDIPGSANACKKLLPPLSSRRISDKLLIQKLTGAAIFSVWVRGVRAMTLRAAFSATAKIAIVAGCLLGLVAAGTVFSDDPLSALVRPRAEAAINGLIASMQKRAAAGTLTNLDHVLLHLGVWGGVAAGQFISPEGAAILRHAVYGDGSDLRLDPSYLKRSPLVAREIERRGPGKYGPIQFRQS